MHHIFLMLAHVNPNPGGSASFSGSNPHFVFFTAGWKEEQTRIGTNRAYTPGSLLGNSVFQVARNNPDHVVSISTLTFS